MHTLEEELRGCCARSTEDEVAWELYVEWQKENVGKAVSIGPALPPALLVERVDAYVPLAPCDLGVFFDALYDGSRGGFVAVELGEEPLCVPPAAVVVEDSCGQHVLCRPFSGPCEEHASCAVHGAVFDHDGSTYPYHECERGSRNRVSLPPPLRDKSVLLPELIRQLLHYAKPRSPAIANGGLGAGAPRMYGLFTRCGDEYDTDDPRAGLRNPLALNRAMRRIWPWAPDWPCVGAVRRGDGGDVASEGEPRGRPIPSDWGPWRFNELNVEGCFNGTARQYRQWRLSRCLHGALYVAGNADCDCVEMYL